MAYVWQRWLADEFRAAGLTVIEVEGWKNRGRPASVGHFHPQEAPGIHHTGTESSESYPNPSLQTLIRGRSDLPGPLCQYAVDYLGRVWVIAAGRANVNGRVGKRGVTGWPYGADGNALGMGNEVMTDGTQRLPEAQRRAIAVTSAVVCKHIGKDPNRLVRHADISGTGKWDLGQLTTQQIRDDASAVTKEDEDMPLSQEDINRIAAAVHGRKINVIGDDKDAPLRQEISEIRSIVAQIRADVQELKGDPKASRR